MHKCLTALLAAMVFLAVGLAAHAEPTTPTDLTTPTDMPAVTPEPTPAPSPKPTDVPQVSPAPTEGPEASPMPGESGMPPGRPGGGGRPSFGRRPSGGGQGGASEGETGFQVTPGKALTQTHASGSRDMTAYGTVSLTPDDEPMRQLTLGGQAVDIDCGGAVFTAAVEDATLTLTAENGAEWRATLAALDTLRISGIERVTLQCAAWCTELDTSLTFTGSAYVRLRAQGYVSADFLLRVTAEGVDVDAAGQTYRLHQSRLEREEERL